MGDSNRDPDLDRAPSDLQSAVERVTGKASDATEAQDGGSATAPTPLEPTGVPDGVGGTAGEVKNQDKAAQ